MSLVRACPTQCRSFPFFVFTVGHYKDAISEVPKTIETHLLIPLLLDVECANAVVLPLVSKQYTFKSFPHPIATTFTPDWNIHVLDLVDPNQSRAQIVETEACLKEVCMLIHILNPQGYPQPSKTPLQLPHTPFSGLAVGKD